MYASVQSEAVFCLFSFAAGAICAFLYDLIRISRRIVAVNTSAMGIQDILFLVAAAVIIYTAAYLKNGGEVRLWGFFCAVLGGAAYAFVVRNRFVNLGTTLLKWLINGILWLIKAVTLPLRLLLRAVKKPVEIIAWYTGRGLTRAKRIAANGKNRAVMRLRAARFMLRKK